LEKQNKIWPDVPKHLKFPCQCEDVVSVVITTIHIYSTVLLIEIKIRW